MKYVDSINTVLEIKEDGIKTIGFKIRDKAGNTSNTVTITIKRDTTKPSKPVLDKEKVKSRECTLTVLSKESNLTYEYYMKKAGEGEKEATLVGNNDKTGKCRVTGLEPNTKYIAYVVAKDEAGNKQESEPIEVTTKKEIKAPEITVSEEGLRNKRMVSNRKRSKSNNNICESRRTNIRKHKIKI